MSFIVHVTTKTVPHKKKSNICHWYTGLIIMHQLYNSLRYLQRGVLAGKCKWVYQWVR